MSIERVLVLEEDVSSVKTLRECLDKKKWELVFHEDEKKALSSLKSGSFDLFLCSIHPNMSTLDLLTAAKEQNPAIIVIFLTSFYTVEKAFEAIGEGAFNYLVKPFSSETLEAMIEKAKQHAALIEENQYLRQEIFVQPGRKREQIIAESPLMKKILEDIAKIAKSNASVFISGESGTGKEVVAHAIHFQSLRLKAPFVKVNCAAIPEPLIESEFFGHEKGAFTGAIAKRLGRFELADTGTLLLDEISEIPLSVQSKLLRAVQEQEFERIGGVKSIRVDVRFLSTSNRNMKEAIESKIFREDLYYRLNVVPLHLPPLRERQEDIIPLAEYFLQRLCEENHKPQKKLSKEASQKLLSYNWPGNIRELANIIERTVVMNAAEQILPDHLCLDALNCKTDFAIPQAPSTELPKLSLEEVEKRHILETLSSQNNNRTKTAKILGISIRTLRNKLKEYKLSV